jgi:hypothetical protein
MIAHQEDSAYRQGSSQTTIQIKHNNSIELDHLKLGMSFVGIFFSVRATLVDNQIKAKGMTKDST